MPHARSSLPSRFRRTFLSSGLAKAAPIANTEPMRILIAEDESRLAGTIARGLREENFIVETSGDGEDALYQLRTKPFDLVILDLMLPRQEGWSVLAALRAERRPIRVLMLTARNTLEDRVRGLEAGADDYLTKPFAFAELLARVRAVLRRPVAEEALHLQFADLVLDYRARTVSRAGQALLLSAKEFAVLAVLMRHPGEVISRTRLAEEVWDENFDSFSNVIDVTVSHLRAKVDRGFDRPLIHTVRGSGYALQEQRT